MLAWGWALGEKEKETVAAAGWRGPPASAQTSRWKGHCQQARAATGKRRLCKETHTPADDPKEEKKCPVQTNGNHQEVLRGEGAVILSNLQTFQLLHFVNSEQGERWEERGLVAKKRQKWDLKKGSSKKEILVGRRREPSQARWHGSWDVQETTTARAAMRRNWRSEIGRREVRRGVVEAGAVGVGAVTLETRVGSVGLACGVGADNSVEIGGTDGAVLRFRVSGTEGRASSNQGPALATWEQAEEAPCVPENGGLQTAAALWVALAVQ